MIFKTLKYGVVIVGAGGLLGVVLFGSDLKSYLQSSAHSVQNAVKDAVPVTFELQRARDTVEQIIPELQANIRLIAHEEVEIAALKNDIEQSQQRLNDQRRRIAQLRNKMDVRQVSYEIGDRRYSQKQVKKDLARRFDRYKESEIVLTGKQRLLETRGQSLQSAMASLDRVRDQKTHLEQQIETLAAQHRLVQASAIGSHSSIDQSKLAEAEKLIGRIKKRLDVAERVLAHEAHFVETIPIDTVSEQDLLTEVDDYFNYGQRTESPVVENESMQQTELVGRELSALDSHR